MSRTRRQPRHRLDPDVRPSRVAVRVEVDPEAGDAFRGEVTTQLEIARPRRQLRLHAVDLQVARPRLEVAGRTLGGRVVRDPAVGMVELRFAERIPAGKATLRLAFAGRLRRDLCGLYRVSVGRRRYAFTQLEATEARKFFPCFDEPAMKARFQLSVTTASGHTALSNAPAARTEPTADGRKTVHFAETPPLSSYLVALALGRLESSRPTHVGPTEIRVWSVPGKRRLAAFGLEAARECLRRLERYFALPYPYAKLDLVAVPDFEFGAMENAGAVFFRETLLLLDPATATLAEEKRAAEVICHELAHMWYGDLVTMAWWDDLWLNEAFATWMAFHIVDDWKPEWNMWQDFQHGRAAALELDALRHTHPIYCDVRTPEQANQNFDLITYEKGASVVRMIERYLGAGAFRRGVRAYIRRHREGSAVAADLWQALSEASGQPVERVARAWIEREGYPLLSLRQERRKGRTELVLHQQRFAAQPLAGRGSARWPLPWVGRIGSGARRSRLERRLVLTSWERIPLRGRAPRFVYGNADESGFFRPLHAPADLAALIAHLPALSTVERMGLVDHQWALVRAGSAPLGSLLELTAALADDREAEVLTALRRPLAFLCDALIPDAAPQAGEAFRAWLAELFEPRFARLGWRASARESDATRLRRAALLALAGGVAAAPAVVAEAVPRCDRYLARRRSLDANLVDAVVALAARNGDAARHRRFLRVASQAATPQEQRRFLLALGDFRQTPLVDRTLELCLTERVATQDIVFLLSRLLANPAARERSWSFVKRRWSELRRRMPPLLASRLIDATPSLLTPVHRRDVARFFRQHPIPSGKRALRQALERFDWYRGFRRRAAAELQAWL